MINFEFAFSVLDQWGGNTSHLARFAFDLNRGLFAAWCCSRGDFNILGLCHCGNCVRNEGFDKSVEVGRKVSLQWRYCCCFVVCCCFREEETSSKMVSAQVSEKFRMSMRMPLFSPKPNAQGHAHVQFPFGAIGVDDSFGKKLCSYDSLKRP